MNRFEGRKVLPRSDSEMSITDNRRKNDETRN